MPCHYDLCKACMEQGNKTSSTTTNPVTKLKSSEISNPLHAFSKNKVGASWAKPDMLYIGKLSQKMQHFGLNPSMDLFVSDETSKF